MAIVELSADVRSQLLAQLTIDSLPAAVRELLQNSIDAGAKTIEIRLDLASLSVYARDDGVGIPALELKNVAKRHHTSKSRNGKPVASSFGFRGEALHSLATTSRTTIVSKTCGNSTYIIRKKPQKEEEPLLFDYDDIVANPAKSAFHIEPIQASGTVVCAHNLFSPLRRNILLGVSDEKVMAELKDVVFLSSLASSVKIRVFKINGRSHALEPVITRLKPPDDTPYSFFHSFREIYGSQALPECQTLTGSYKNCALNGVIGTRPSFSSKFQFVFVNGRPMRIPDTDSKTIASMFSDAKFGSLLISSPSKRSALSPVFIVNFTASDGLQETPKASMERLGWPTMFKMLLNVFSSFLNVSGYQYTLTPQASPRKRRRPDGSPSKKATSPKISPTPRITSPCDEAEVRSIETRDVKLSREDLEKCTIIRQLEKKFILVTVKREAGNFLVVLDQHACDERIRVEEMLRDFVCLLADEEVDLRQTIESEIVMELPVDEVSVFLGHEKQLNRCGIDFTCDKTMVKITHLPEILHRTKSETVKGGLLEYVTETSGTLGALKKGWFSLVAELPRVIIDAFNSRACRSAVMFGDELLKDEMGFLVRNLSQCVLPFQCAHGRPTVAPIAEMKGGKGEAKGRGGM